MNSIIVLSVTGIVVLFSGLFDLRKWSLPLGIIGSVIALWLGISEWSTNISYFNNMLLFDNMALAFASLQILVAIAVLLLLFLYKHEFEHFADIQTLLIFSLVGGILMVSYSNLVMLFLGIEILSIPLYILVASKRYDASSAEAGLKYFILGAFSSAVLVMGIAFVYGTTNTFDIGVMKSIFSSNADVSSLFKLGVLLILVAFGFKIAAVPFHFWAPDVYQGAPAFATAFMATVVKIAGFGALLRFTSIFPFEVSHQWAGVLIGLIIATLLLSNITALWQTDFKRLIAYSGVSNSGFLLLAILTYSPLSNAIVLYYVAAYSLATITVLSIFIVLKEKTGKADFSIFKGLFIKKPLMAIALTVSLLSLSGIPPFMGFFGKYYLFFNTINKGMLGLSVFAILAAVVAVYYYLRIASQAYTLDNENAETIEITTSYKIFLFISIALSIVLGLFPSVIYRLI